MSETALFPRKMSSHFCFIDGSGSGYGNGSGTVMHFGSGSAKTKSYGSCGSDSTTLVTNVRTGTARKTATNFKNEMPETLYFCITNCSES